MTEMMLMLLTWQYSRSLDKSRSRNLPIAGNRSFHGPHSTGNAPVIGSKYWLSSLLLSTSSSCWGKSIPTQSNCLFSSVAPAALVPLLFLTTIIDIIITVVRLMQDFVNSYRLANYISCICQTWVRLDKSLWLDNFLWELTTTSGGVGMLRHITIVVWVVLIK